MTGNDWTVAIIITVLVVFASLLDPWAKKKVPNSKWKRGIVQMAILLPAIAMAVWLLPKEFNEHYIALMIGVGAGIAIAELSKRVFKIGK